MGGYGSGQWYRYGSKSTTDASKRLDIRFLRRNSWLFTGRVGTLSWSIGGEPSGSIGYTVHDDRLVLNYNCTPHGEESKAITQNIYFIKTSCNYGGERTWLMCPYCGTRRDVLYMNGCRFSCRICADLAYNCQQEQSLDRNYRQARKIRHKLITNYEWDSFEPDNLFDNPIFKPKGMHQKTFDRLRLKQARYVDSGLKYVSAYLDRIGAK